MQYIPTNKGPFYNKNQNIPDILIKSLNEWNIWYINSPDCVISNIYSNSISFTNNSYIVFCVFLNIESSIRVSCDISLCVEECSFVDCQSSGYGGAIYFKDGSNCVINKICANRCNSSIDTYNYGQFCYIGVKTGDNSMNIANLLSVSQCAQNENQNKPGSIYLFRGNISLKNFNSSTNICSHYSGCVLGEHSNSSAKYSTFFNNTDYYVCLGFWFNVHQISLCNIIKNHQNDPSFGTVYNEDSDTTMSSCIIDMNTGIVNIISVWSGCVTLHNCYLQSNQQTYADITILSPISESHSLIMNHFFSHICQTHLALIDDNHSISSFLILYHTNSLIFLLLTHLTINT